MGEHFSSLQAMEDKLDRLFKDVETIPDERLKRELCAYLCIRISGYWEKSVETLFLTYVKDRSKPEIYNFIKHSLQDITNLKDSKLQNLLKNFSENIGEVYLYTRTDKQKDAIDSIVSIRNTVAHGGDNGTSLVNIKKYYSEIKEVVKLLRDEVLK